PAAAYLLAGGDTERVDSAYLVATTLFVLLGVYWSALWCVRANVHPAWAAAYLLVPAVLVSLDRGTVDVSLAALCAGFAVYAASPPGVAMAAVLLLAPFARETGLVLPA